MSDARDTITLIEQALASLDPSQLDIQDDSHLHAGHAGNTGGGHYTITIVSEVFNGLLPLARHRLVYQAVGDLMQTHIHALSIHAKTAE